ncbi:hypothetical protein RGR602_PB00205 (plasmid) [Rhizobium gallicum bv. gallicum R602sp]|uniref:Uncharacterized protein n=1 Tax=Rhizobium gallicum bv. gallicum R602sp TaxID=1041138 RepID=A0A0B4XB19_9HYPH|nr:hypothetical protein RGR602_PB00205 [Rhizobium gallicum bv. gallicum R602sp]
MASARSSAGLKSVAPCGPSLTTAAKSSYRPVTMMWRAIRSSTICPVKSDYKSISYVL